MNSTIARILVPATAVAGLLSSTVAQTTISLVADKDVTLIEDPAGGLTNDAGIGIFVGRVGLMGGETIRRAIVHFDVAGNLPAGAKVLSAELDLFAAQSSAFLPIQTFAHRVTTDWNEGPTAAPGNGGNGTGAAAGDTTWLHADFPGAFWNNVGGDFAPSPSFSFPLPGIGPVTATATTGMVGDVQSWLDAPSGNYGWLLKTDELLGSNARRINSHEAGSLAPTLRITFLAPGQTGSYGTGWPVGAGTFDLDITGTATGNTTVTFDLTNAPSSTVGAFFFGIELDPVGTQLIPACSTCRVYLPLLGLIVPGDAFVTSPAGAATSTFVVPNAPGFLLNVQAAAIDATPLGVSLSNAGVMVTQ